MFIFSQLVTMLVQLYLCLVIFGLVQSQGTTFYCLRNGEVSQINENSGTIKTLHQGQSTYSNNQECKWAVDVGENKNTKVQFTVLSNALEWVPEGSICNGYDYVQIMNGDSEYAPVQLTWCGKYSPRKFITMGPKVFIQFSSNDRNINAYSGATLEYNTFTIGSGSCPQGWLEYKDHCYSIEDHEETWISAYEYCKFMGANLVSFEDNEEAAFINGVISDRAAPRTTDYYWLGLTDTETEGQFEWLDRISSTVDFRWIAENHESDSYSDCVVVRSSDGKWEEQFCTDADVRTLTKHKYICKRNKTEETQVYPPPEEKPDTEGKGTIAIGRRYIIAAVIVSVTIIILIICAVLGYRRFGDDLKQKLKSRGKHREDAESDSEAVPLPPYTRNDPRPPPTAPTPDTTTAQISARNPSPPPPYSPQDTNTPTYL